MASKHLLSSDSSTSTLSGHTSCHPLGAKYARGRQDSLKQRHTRCLRFLPSPQPKTARHSRINCSGRPNHLRPHASQAPESGSIHLVTSTVVSGAIRRTEEPTATSVLPSFLPAC